MAFKEGQTHSFPFERTDNGIWYFIVKSDEIIEYKSTVSNQKDLVRDISKYLRHGFKFQLMGVWHGQYRTDIFVLEPANALIRLEDEKKFREISDGRKKS
jgi:hypothetical protein